MFGKLINLMASNFNLFSYRNKYRLTDSNTLYHINYKLTFWVD